MVTLSPLLPFAGITLGMVLTPGPNMIYLISRSISQGRRAGYISLSGVALGFMFYMLCAALRCAALRCAALRCAALGITALLMAVPMAYDVLRFAGVIYLLWMAWQAICGGKSAFQLRDLPPDSAGKLFSMGLFTNLLNPKAAVIYLTLLPQFIHPAQGHVLGQSLALGFSQIVISMLINGGIIFTARGIASFLASRLGWQKAQRWLMGAVLAGLALKMRVDNR